MRDYVLSQAEILGRGTLLGYFRRLLRNWRARRQVRHMLGLEDRLLDDIGVHRADLELVLKQPLEVDPGRELERLTLARRRGLATAPARFRG